MSLEKLQQWKHEMGRPKDVRHIELIEQYLQDHKPAPAH